MADESDAPDAYLQIFGGSQPASSSEPLNLSEQQCQYLARLAASEYRSRRFRDDVMPRGLFAEPAWDMLLDLFINRINAQRVSISSLCHAAAVPTTTALRHISLLQEYRLIVRSNASHDNRVSFVDLTDEGYLMMARILERRAKF